MAPSRLLPLALLAALPLPACTRPAPPTLTAFTVTAAEPRAVVMIQGSNLESSRIVWDAGTSAERVLPGGYLGAFMFSVPDGASVGPHTVAVANGGGQSANLTFTVNPPLAPLAPFPAPRIDHITLFGAQFNTSGLVRQVTATLYVQGANIDVGAVVRINGADVATTAHRTLLNNWYGVPLSELGYPIYHYLSTFAIAGTRPANSTLNVTVRNLDGKISPIVQYKLPLNAAGMDSDGDRLLDSWETGGYDANGDGMIDVNLPALGADPKRRDLFVELDVMDNVQRPPGAAAIAAVETMFASAPILNPLTTDTGIKLHIDPSGKPCLQRPAGRQGVPGEQGAQTLQGVQGLQLPPRCDFQYVAFDKGNLTAPPSTTDPFVTGIVNFSRLKAASFDNAIRGRIYHYAIWGIEQDDGSSGNSDFADDFLVAFDRLPNFGASYDTVTSRSEQLAHELGHDLRQRHGGDDHLPKFKPNYMSVMSYNWDLRTGRDHVFRQKHVTCLPFYYAAAGADEIGGVVPASASPVVNYSEGMAKTLVRPPAGSTVLPSLCGKTFLWETLGVGVSTIKDFANWPALAFDGPELNVRSMDGPGIEP